MIKFSNWIHVEYSHQSTDDFTAQMKAKVTQNLIEQLHDTCQLLCTWYYEGVRSNGQYPDEL
jgi:hypothetical protein